MGVHAFAKNTRSMLEKSLKVDGGQFRACSVNMRAFANIPCTYTYYVHTRVARLSGVLIIQSKQRYI